MYTFRQFYKLFSEDVLKPEFTPKIQELLDGLDMHFRPPLRFIEKYSVFLSPVQLEKFNNLEEYKKRWEDVTLPQLDDTSVFYEFDSDYYSSDEFTELEEELIENIIQNINPYLLKYAKQTATFEIDGGQSGYYDDVTLLINLNDVVGAEEDPTPEKFIVGHHVTKVGNKSNILRNGILPKAAYEGGISYEPRVFFYKNLPEKETLISNSIMFQGKPSVSLAGNKSTENITDATVFTFKIPSLKYKIYKDPDIEEGFYVKKQIPVRFIKSHKDIKLT